MATCDTLGIVTVTPNLWLCRRKSMAVARGIAIVQRDEPFLVNLCNLAKTEIFFESALREGSRNPT